MPRHLSSSSTFSSSSLGQSLCPYQTPASRVLQNLGQKVYSALSALRNAFGKSKVVWTIAFNVRFYHPRWSRNNITRFLNHLVHDDVPPAFITDVRRLWRAAMWKLSTLPAGAYCLARREPRLNWQIIALDFRCISLEA
jgi:hypothetical protein